MVFRGGEGVNPAAMTTAAALELEAATVLADGSREELEDLLLLSVARAMYVERLCVRWLPVRDLDALVGEPVGNVIPLRPRHKRGAA